MKLSFKNRQRKRKRRARMQTDQREARRSGSSSGKWWLTPTRTTTCCARCGGVLRPPCDMVYRRTPREALCLLCADGDPLVKWKPSLAWERRKVSGRRVRPDGKPTAQPHGVDGVCEATAPTAKADVSTGRSDHKGSFGSVCGYETHADHWRPHPATGRRTCWICHPPAAPTEQS